MSHDHSHHDSHQMGHIIPKSVYTIILITLLVLTFITVAIAQVDFGTWNIVVAMLVASIKAGLVGLFFMHLKYENKIIWLYVLFPILLLFIMIGGIFSDNPLRVKTVPVEVKSTQSGN